MPHTNPQTSHVTLCRPLTSPPFSLYYRATRGLSACRPSSRSSFPPTFRPPAGRLLLSSRGGGEAPLQETIKERESACAEEGTKRVQICVLAVQRGPAVNLRCPMLTILPLRMFICSEQCRKNLDFIFFLIIFFSSVI